MIALSILVFQQHYPTFCQLHFQSLSHIDNFTALFDNVLCESRIFVSFGFDSTLRTYGNLPIRKEYCPILRFVLISQLCQYFLNMIGIFRGGIQVKAQAGENAQIHAVGQCPTDEPAGALQAG